MTGTRVSGQAEKALRAAMERLLAGKPTRTDGRLIKENLYREAGVSQGGCKFQGRPSGRVVTGWGA
jgi:hypothetical protein